MGATVDYWDGCQTPNSMRSTTSACRVESEAFGINALELPREPESDGHADRCMIWWTRPANSDDRTIILQVREVNSGSPARGPRESTVIRPAPWDRYQGWYGARLLVADLMETLQEPEHSGVGLVSMTDALDRTASDVR